MATKADKKDPESPATTSYAYDVMAPRWHKIDTLLGGTETMKGAGEKYLPRHDSETDLAYEERLAANSLVNMTELTLDQWVGKPFSEQLTVLEETPDEVKALAEDIDLMGNDIDVFARNWFRSGLAKAFSHVLIDFTRPQGSDEEDGEEPGQRTLDDDRREGLRPYWIDVQPERVLFAASEIVDGREQLTQLRILDIVTEVVGFAEVATEKIYVFTPGQKETYRKEEQKGNRKDKWVLESTETYDLDFIPLVTFYAKDRDALMLAKPPLTDIADLNITHWQSSSDQRAALTVARFPILALSGGVDDKKDVVVGPRKLLYSPDPQSKFYYVENEGKALEAGREDLNTLVDQMAYYGADYMRKRPAQTTATARVIDNAEATSPLQDSAMRFEDAFNTALTITAMYMRIEDMAGGAEIHKDFGPGVDNDKELKTLWEARKNRDISRETFLTELKRRDYLSDDFDIVQEMGRIETEAMTLGGASLVDLDADEGGDE